MSRRAAPKAHSIEVRSTKVFLMSRPAVPKAHSTVVRSTKVIS